MSQLRRHYLVTGRVQGVGYRYFTRGAARQHGVTGWVRNLPNGDVELEAQGEVAALDRLERDLLDGPPLSLVRSVQPSERAVVPGETAFAVRF